MKHAIRAFMTPDPHTVERSEHLSAAGRIMQANGIRHLPVVENGRVVGVLSDREVQLVEAFSGGLFRRVLVDDAMTPNPYSADPETPVSEVCRVMAEKKYGCVVIVSDGKPVGVFTSTDGLYALSVVYDRLSEPSSKATP